jgi:high-affinity nickel permease
MEMGDKTLEELISPKEVPIILYSFLIAQSVNLFTNIVSKNIGDLIGLGLNIFLLLLIILGFITHSRFKKKRREQLKSLDMDSLISSKELEFKRKYRGLIAFISDPPPP